MLLEHHKHHIWVMRQPENAIFEHIIFDLKFALVENYQKY